MTSGDDRPVVGVGAVVRDGNNILLVKRGREPGRGLWAVPGGKVERGEELRATARREVEEETGLRIEVGDPVWVGEVIEGDHHIVLIDFAARLVGGVMSPGDDADEVRWVAIDAARSLPLTQTMHSLLDSLAR